MAVPAQTPALTTSAKIRALAKAGHPRAEIARMLDIRYQHVRNVLEADAAKGANPATAAVAPTSLKARVQVGGGGRVVIPAEMRLAMGIAEGDVLTATVVDGELRLLSQQAAIRKAQSMVREFVPEGISLVDQLIEDRRTEGRRDDDA